MKTLRNSRHIARFMLVWFALFLGVAVASPLLHLQSGQMVCSTQGITKVVSAYDHDSAPVADQLLECPLCAGIGAPPPFALLDLRAELRPLGQPLLTAEAALSTSATAAPPPARGPPASL